MIFERWSKIRNVITKLSTLISSATMKTSVPVVKAQVKAAFASARKQRSTSSSSVPHPSSPLALASGIENYMHVSDLDLTHYTTPGRIEAITHLSRLSVLASRNLFPRRSSHPTNKLISLRHKPIKDLLHLKITESLCHLQQLNHDTVLLLIISEKSGDIAKSKYIQLSFVYFS